MAQTLNSAQRTHTDTTLARTETALNTVRSFYRHDVSPPHPLRRTFDGIDEDAAGISTYISADTAAELRQQCSVHIAEIRRQRRALDRTSSNIAHKWVDAATTQWSSLRRDHPAAFTTAPPPATLNAPTTTPTATPTPAPSPVTTRTRSSGCRSTQPRPQKRSQKHQQELHRTFCLLAGRRRALIRAARVTTGALHTAIINTIDEINDDLAALATMSTTALRHCRTRHHSALTQWNTRGAEAVLPT